MTTPGPATSPMPAQHRNCLPRTLTSAAPFSPVTGQRQEDDLTAPLTVVVAGASSGFGAALAAELAAEGHQIVAGGRRPRVSSRGLRYLPVDVTDADEVARFAAAAIRELGRVDGLVYCAADSGAVGR